MSFRTMALVAVALSTLVLACEDDFGARCTLPAKVREACEQQGTNGSGLESRVNCVMLENIDCSSRVCAIYQDNGPFCTQECKTDSDCPSGSVCRPFTIYEDSDLYCVPRSELVE